jgi:hypothetical protein
MLQLAHKRDGTMPRKTLPPLTLPMVDGAVELTPEQWQQYISPNLEDFQGELETVGVWQTPVSFKAPAVSATYDNFGITAYTLYGPRSLSGCYPSSYHLEGTVSVKNSKRKAFTSSLMCRLPDGKLLETATIHARIK